MKNTSLLISMVLLASACSKTVKEVHLSPAAPQSNELAGGKSETSNMGHLSRLLSSEAPNLALAELIASSMSETEKKTAKEIIQELSSDEITQIVQMIEKDNKLIRSQYYFHGQNYEANKDLLKNSLIEMNARVSESIFLEDRLKTTTFTYIKNKALDEILDTYDKRAHELSKDLALAIAHDIATKSPQEAAAIEKLVKSSSKEVVLRYLEKSKIVANTLNSYFKSSTLNENEQYAVIGTGVLAGAVYLVVKDNDGFQRIVTEGKKIISDVQKLQRKAQEFVTLVTALDTHLNTTEKNLMDFQDGMKGSAKDFKDMFQEARAALNKPTNVNSKKIMEFMHEKIIRGKDVPVIGTNPSILERQVRINANLQKSINAASGMATNLSGILNTTEKMMNLFKIKPSEGLTKVIDKAKKVAAVVQTVQSVTLGFATGGPIGAIAALGSSPLLASALGGGDATGSALKEINRKLDVIIENQKKMMEMQLETMKMIKDLALVVDQYHQEEMRKLSELRDDLLVNLEIGKALLNQDIRSCERMINFQLSSVWKAYDFKMDSLYAINDLKIINSKFYSNINSLDDIRRVVNSVEANGFERCQNGIAEAFGGNSVSENPLKSIFSSSENENLLRFQKETYLPLLEVLYAQAGTTNLDSVPLHLPSANFKGVFEKSAFVKHAITDASTNNLYELEDLISTKGLERYASQLLVLHPFLDVDKEIWKKDVGTIVDTYLMNSNIHSNQNMRSYYFLSNALKLVQSAIAQETLLAGEPVLPGLHSQYLTQLFSNADCRGLDIERGTDYGCFLRENSLLMKNLVAYSLNWSKRRSGSFMNDYKDAYSKSNLAALAKMISPGLTADRLITKSNEHYLVLNIKKQPTIEIKLPSIEAVEKEIVMYSENMSHLIQLQTAIIENLEKVAPLMRSNRNNDLMKLMMAGVK